jgi:hypothetical protein
MEFKKGDRVIFNDVAGIGTPYENAMGTVLYYRTEHPNYGGDVMRVTFDDDSLHNYNRGWCSMYPHRFRLIGGLVKKYIKKHKI